MSNTAPKRPTPRTKAPRVRPRAKPSALDRAKHKPGGLAWVMGFAFFGLGITVKSFVAPASLGPMGEFAVGAVLGGIGFALGTALEPVVRPPRPAGD